MNTTLKQVALGGLLALVLLALVAGLAVTLPRVLSSVAALTMSSSASQTVVPVLSTSEMVPGVHVACNPPPCDCPEC